MFFRQLVSPACMSLAYVLADAGAAEAVVIDAGSEDHPIVLALLDERRMRLRWVLRTHSHDGVDDGAPALCLRTGATLAGGSDRLRLLADGETLAFGAELLRVITVPGHTADSVAFLWRDRLFCGDTIDPGGGNRAHTTHIDPGRLYDSVTGKLFVLPDDTLVFPAHAHHDRRVSTIAEERTRNRCFVQHSRDAFVAACGRAHTRPARGRSPRSGVDPV
jgi:glyoxylase-like metal-dependent hydrolase (beta-lactamase superfamily II)